MSVKLLRMRREIHASSFRGPSVGVATYIAALPPPSFGSLVLAPSLCILLAQDYHPVHFLTAELETVAGLWSLASYSYYS